MLEIKCGEVENWRTEKISACFGFQVSEPLNLSFQFLIA